MKNITVSRDKVEQWLEDLEFSDSDKNVIADIKQALAAPVQKQALGFEVVLDESLPPNTMKFVQPAPVPLTPEQIIDIRRKTTAKTHGEWADTKAFARAIEAAHGITEKGQP
jgi:hypothetical protein